MNGWMRLWVFLSLIWASIVISVGAFIIYEDTYSDVEGPWLVYRLSDTSRVFFEGLTKGETGPVYSESFSYLDGTKYSIRFSLLEEEVFNGEFSEKIQKIAQDTGKEITPAEMQRFAESVKQRNTAAGKAKRELEAEVSKAELQQKKLRKDILENTVASLCIPVIPPFLVAP